MFLGFGEPGLETRILIVGVPVRSGHSSDTWLSDTAVQVVERELELDILRLDHLITLVGTGYGGRCRVDQRGAAIEVDGVRRENTVGSRTREFQRRIKCILTRGSKDTPMNIIGKKSTEAASIHSDFQGVVPLKVTVLHAEVNRLFKYDN